uniref:Uncharacterized protein n=1 Tax=Anguilla anguilla TaxID=7936 RepID=A0A0E9S2B3_ANGAN
MGSLCLVMFLCLNVGKSYGIVVTCDVFGSQTHPLKLFFSARIKHSCILYLSKAQSYDSV